MTTTELTKLEHAQQVKWVGELSSGESEADCRAHIGYVAEVGCVAVRVKWDDGIMTTHYFSSETDAANIERVA